jgi:hypothetical protein
MEEVPTLQNFDEVEYKTAFDKVKSDMLKVSDQLDIVERALSSR